MSRSTYQVRSLPEVEIKKIQKEANRRHPCERPRSSAFTWRPKNKNDIEKVHDILMSHSSVKTYIFVYETINNDPNSVHIHGLIQHPKNTGPTESVTKSLYKSMCSGPKSSVKVDPSHNHIAWMVYLAKQSNIFHFPVNSLGKPDRWVKSIIESFNSFIDGLHSHNWEEFDDEEPKYDEINTKSDLKLDKKFKLLVRQIELFGRFMKENNFFITDFYLLYEHLGNNVYTERTRDFKSMLSVYMINNQIVISDEQLTEFLGHISKMISEQTKCTIQNEALSYSTCIEPYIIDIDYNLIRFEDFAIITGEKGRMITEGIDKLPTVHYEPSITWKNHVEKIQEFYKSDRPWVQVFRDNNLFNVETLTVLSKGQGRRVAGKHLIPVASGPSNTSKSNAVVDIKANLFPEQYVIDYTGEINKFSAQTLDGGLLIVSHEGASLIGSQSQTAKTFFEGRTIDTEQKHGSRKKLKIEQVMVIATNADNCEKYIYNDAIGNRCYFILFEKVYESTSPESNKIIEAMYKEDLYLTHLFLSRFDDPTLNLNIPSEPSLTQNDVLKKIEALSKKQKDKTMPIENLNLEIALLKERLKCLEDIRDNQNN